MTRIITKAEILATLPGIDLVESMEAAFVAYSSGLAIVPPVGELLFESPPGDVHIKYGYVRGEPYYVVKVASGFYNNPALGLPTGNGLMLLFSQATGALEAVLLDHGLLTDERTAAAGAVAAKYLAPQQPNCIGIVGTGAQAELQLRHLAAVSSCRDVLVWGRSNSHAEGFCERLADSPFQITVASNIDALINAARLIVTTTPAVSPLLDRLQPGTHVTAMGSDTADKQELDASLLAAADLVVSDSRAQSGSRGEVFRALQAGQVTLKKVLELGNIISGEVAGRTSAEQVTIADLTGVATQDIAIATAVYERISNSITNDI